MWAYKGFWLEFTPESVLSSTVKYHGYSKPRHGRRVTRAVQLWKNDG